LSVRDNDEVVGVWSYPSLAMCREAIRMRSEKVWKLTLLPKTFGLGILIPQMRIPMTGYLRFPCRMDVDGDRIISTGKPTL